MVEATLNFQPGAAVSSAPPGRIALLGNPNCGKTALFNLLTGSRQKVANYAGVTVERKEGLLRTAVGPARVRARPAGRLQPECAVSADEAVTRDVVTGKRASEALPDLLVCVTDATNLRLNLRLVLEASAWACRWWWRSTWPTWRSKRGIHGRRRASSRANWACRGRDRRRAARRRRTRRCSTRARCAAWPAHRAPTPWHGAGAWTT